MRKIITSIILLLIFFQSGILVAQGILKNEDLSTIQVDYLSDSDIAKIKSQLEDKNMTIEQAKPMVLGKGMSEIEFKKLEKRLKSESGKKSKDKVEKSEDGDQEYTRKQEKVDNRKIKDTVNVLIFGSELFDNPTLNFEPNLKLATPVNYVLGPGDELQISVNGVQEYSGSAPVTSEGNISIQYVGQIAVSGMTIEAATQKIKGALAGVYSTISSGQSQVNVSLSRIRTIKVTIVGGRQPGNYSISSLATVYNALYLAGGPGKNGSYRNIELLRNNKVYKTIDIYRFLVSGDQSDNVGLKDNDVIRIPAYTSRVTVNGEVKRPGIFEIKNSENFTNLISFASGFTDVAYTASVNVEQKTEKGFKVNDIKSSQYSSYKPQAGDVFNVTKISDRFENRVIIKGAVFRPGTYSFYEGMRISELVKKADGLKEDAYTSRATIVRLKVDLTTEVTNVNLLKALSGDVDSDITLKREDIVTVYSILDMREDYKVTIDGEVKRPGIYSFNENLTLNDLLIQAGGLAGSASKRVEIARMVKLDEVNKDNVKSKLFNIEISADSNEQAKNFTLEPYDVVNIRRMPNYSMPEAVVVTGAVNYTGKYVLLSKSDKIYDVIQRAGGLNSVADVEGVKIKRRVSARQIEDAENINMNLGKRDSIQKKLNKRVEEVKYAVVPIDWKKIVKDPKSDANVILIPGDEIVVADFNETVKVAGGVVLTSEIPYKKGKGFGYYLNSVGGIDAKAWRKKAYIVYPNGQAAVNHTFLFMNFSPKVLPGSQILVPEQPEKRRMSPGEWVSIGSVFTSLCVLLITAFK